MFTGVSVESIASVFRVKVKGFLEKSVNIYQTTQRNVLE
jgi:hypothetical protein